MTRRWRPTLGFVLGGALTGTLALSLAGLVAFRYLGPAIGFSNAALLLAGLITLATSVLGWLLVRLLLRPITALERYAAEVRAAPRDPVTPPAHFGTRELHVTALSVIDMANTLRNRETTIRSHTDHVTHELRSPVSAIRAAAELLGDGGSLDAADRRLLAEITGAAAQIEAQLGALRRVAQARETRHAGHATLDALGPALEAEHPGLAIAVEGGQVRVPLAADGLRIVLGHLLGNSLCAGARRVTLAARAADGQVRLSVADDGPGVSDGNRDRVFEPFFTTRRGQGGTGMGLAIVRAMVGAHGGTIALRQGASGAVFELCFPAAD